MKRGVLALSILAAVLCAPPAAAHANYVSSEPPQGARLAVAPARVSVALSQEVDTAGSLLTVLDAGGRRLDNGDLVVEGDAQPRLAVTLVPDLGDGAYRVEWKALSRVDHHTTQGSFGFAVGNFTPPEAEQSSNNAPGAGSLVGRSAFFLGFCLSLAGLLFALVVAPGQVVALLRRVDLAGWSLVAAGSGVLLGDAAVRAGIGPAEWWVSSVVRELVVRFLLACVGLAVVVLARTPNAYRMAVAGLSLVSLAYLSGRSGHASVGGWLVAGIDGLHLLVTAAWVGGLALFAYLVLAGSRIGVAGDPLIGIGRRFSRLALACVLGMAVSGVTLAVLILGWPALARPLDWFQGTYGGALLGKILLATGMVGLAAVNRLVFLGRLLNVAEPVVERMRGRFGRFVAAEAAIGIVVVGLAGLLTSTSPPYAAQAEPAVEVTAESGEFRVLLQIASAPRPGMFSDLRFHITWLQDNSTVDRDNCGRTEGCILVEVIQPGAEEQDEDEEDIHKGGEHRALVPVGDGWWVVEDVLFVEEGHYELLLEIQTEYVYFDAVSLHIAVSENASE